jgi:hypothetical protein
MSNAKTVPSPIKAEAKPAWVGKSGLDKDLDQKPPIPAPVR